MRLSARCGNAKNSSTRCLPAGSLRCKRNCLRSSRRTPRSSTRDRSMLYTRSLNLSRRNHLCSYQMNSSSILRTQSTVSSYSYTRNLIKLLWSNLNDTGFSRYSIRRRTEAFRASRETQKRNKLFIAAKRRRDRTSRSRTVQTRETYTIQGK